jgi:tetratricopeptide (TPR) repeat protein
VPWLFTTARLKSVLRRPPVVVSILSLAAVLAFIAVSHLVHRYREEEKALARHLYGDGQAQLNSGKPDNAIAYFRAALTYDPADFSYQLSLARALRDTGRIPEAKSYLLALWESSPDDASVNLALGRLAVREGDTAEAIHYYHNATYGVWNSDPETHRRDARFELIDFLLRQNALPQAQAELITLAASLPRNPELEIQVAQRFAKLGDYEHALSEYQTILQHDKENVEAEEGAGECAFELHRYATAEKYLSAAARADHLDPQLEQELRIARLIIESDPFIHWISGWERDRRIQEAFKAAGERLNRCGKLPEAGANGTSEANPGSTGTVDVNSLRQSWNALNAKPSRRSASTESEKTEQMMNLVFEVEQQTQKDCELTDIDQALLLIGEDRDGADR